MPPDQRTPPPRSAGANCRTSRIPRCIPRRPAGRRANGDGPLPATARPALCPQSSGGIRPCSLRSRGPIPIAAAKKCRPKRLARQMLASRIARRAGARQPPHFRSGASDLIPAAGCHAPDPCGHDRALLSGSEAPLLFGFRPAERPRIGLVPMGRPAAATTAFLRRAVGFRPGVAATLGRPLTVGGVVRYCAVFWAAWMPRHAATPAPAPPGQRSFNWQSTAFVMRGLWVRFPPLALVPRSQPPVAAASPWPARSNRKDP